MKWIWYNLFVIAVGLTAFGEGDIKDDIRRRVEVYPDARKNKAFRMNEGSAHCELSLYAQFPWRIRSSRIKTRDEATLWKKDSDTEYFILNGYAANEYVVIEGDLYQNGNGGDRASRPPKFQVTVPKVNLQWDGQHGECSEEAKEDEIPAALLVSDKSKFFGKLFVDIPEDDFALVDPCVTLSWDSPRSVKVYQGEKELKSGQKFEMRGGRVELAVRAVSPTDKVKFTLEGEKDNADKDQIERAVDFVYAKCVPAGIEFVTPAGDPVASPKDSGDGQNEFTFSSASPGVLTMNLKAKVTPAEALEMVKDSCVFTVDAIGSSVMEWAEDNPGGKAQAENGCLTATVKFTGLPAHNSDFGKKKARIACKGVVCDEKEYEVFFPKVEKNHPKCQTCPSCSNWFYYWREGDVCLIPNDAIWAEAKGDNEGCRGWHHEGRIYLTDLASGENDGKISLSADFTIPKCEFKIEMKQKSFPLVTNKSKGEKGMSYYVSDRLLESSSACESIILQLNGKGIGCAAQTVVHELEHKAIWQRNAELSRQYYAWCDRIEEVGNEFGPESIEYALEELKFATWKWSFDDRDLDGVTNGEEMGGEKYKILSDVTNPDTYNFSRYFDDGSGYEIYADEDVRVRSIEHTATYHVELDWSNPGCQYGNDPYGPER